MKGKKTMVIQRSIAVSTRGNGDMHDITGPVSAVVRSSGIKSGTAHVFVVGSTSAIGTIEFEPGLQRDLCELLNRMIPQSANYGHEQAWHDGNGHSHLQATLLGSSITVPIRSGDLAVGTWQQIILLECDIRNRKREVIVTLMGE